MTALPRGWSFTTIENIADINPRHPRSLEDSLQVTFVRMPALSETDWKFEYTEERILGQVRKGYTHFAEGDVLFAKITPCMENGKAAVASGLINGLGCGTTELHVLRPLGDISAKYIYHFTHRESFREEAARNFTGSAGQLRVPISFVSKAQIPIAPLNEQRRIVAKLEKLLGRVAAAQTRLANLPVILKRFRQSVLAAACSGRLTKEWREEHPSDHVARLFESIRPMRHIRFQDSAVRGDLDLHEIPGTWLWTNLRFLLSPSEAFCYGVVQPGFDDPEGIFLVRAGDLSEGRVDTTALRRISKDVSDEYRRSQLSGGEVLVTVVGAGIGETAIAQAECGGFNVARAVAKLPVREFDARYVRLWLSTPRAVTWMKQDSREVARPTLNLEQLQTLPVPIPPPGEQQEIVRRVEALFKTADALEARYLKAKAHVDRLRQSVLAKAFRGELVPQDPSDEPASQLLEKIRQAGSSNSQQLLTTANSRRKGRG